MPALVRDKPRRTSSSERRRQRVGEAAGDLLVQHVHEGVARAAGLARDRRRLEVVDLAVADAPERRHPRAELVIDLDVELVVEVLAPRQRVEVVGDARHASAPAGPASTFFANGVMALAGITPSA